MLFNFITGLSFILTLFGILTQIKIISLLFLIGGFFYFIKKNNFNAYFYPILFFLIFLGFSVLTLFFSYDKASNIEYLITFFASFFSFLISIENQKKIKKLLKYLFIIGSIITIISLITTKLFSLEYSFNSLSLLYSYYFHSPTSYFLVLSLVYFSYLFIKENKKFYLILFLLIFPFFFIGFNRTSYFSLVCSLLIFLYKEKIKNIFSKIIIILVTFISLIGLIFINNTENYFSKKLNDFLKFSREKTLSGNREKYLSDSLKVFINNPLGVGGLNLHFHTSRYRFDKREETTTSHNFFIDVLAEYGFFSFASIVLFLIYLIKKSNKDEFFYVFLSYNFLFLGSFAHRYDFFLIFYFVIAGLIIKKETKEKKLKINKIYIIMPLILVLFVNFIISTSYYLFIEKNQKEKALKIYPIKWQFYSAIVYESKYENYQKAIEYFKKFKLLFEKGGKINMFKALNSLELEKNKQDKIFYLEKAFAYEPIFLSDYFDEYINLIFENYGEKEGEKYAEKQIKSLLKQINPPNESYLKKIIKANCNFYHLKCF